MPRPSCAWATTLVTLPADPRAVAASCVVAAARAPPQPPAASAPSPPPASWRDRGRDEVGGRRPCASQARDKVWPFGDKVWRCGRRKKELSRPGYFCMDPTIQVVEVEVTGLLGPASRIRAGPCCPPGQCDGPSMMKIGSCRAWAGPNSPCFGRSNRLRAAWTTIHPRLG